MLQKLRNWFTSAPTPAPTDVEAMEEGKRLQEDMITVRVSQTGRQPFAGVPPTPDLLDPERDDR
jgi:hypothetical protein